MYGYKKHKKSSIWLEHKRFLINEFETNRSKYRIHEEISIIVVNALRKNPQTGNQSVKKFSIYASSL
jgi:hypothetical protein